MVPSLHTDDGFKDYVKFCNCFPIDVSFPRNNGTAVCTEAPFPLAGYIRTAAARPQIFVRSYFNRDPTLRLDRRAVFNCLFSKTAVSRANQ